MFKYFININNYVCLPLSKNEILLNTSGSVINSSGTLLKVETLNDEQFVKIDWVDGYRYYRVADLVAFCFKPIKLPPSFWKSISVLFLDRDKNNFHPSNLIWKFPIGLGSSLYNGFAFIPSYTRYMINKDGILFDRLSNKIIEGHFNKGYHSYSVVSDSGKRTSLKRHRAICLAFTDYPVNVDLMQVNHKNGNTGDDSFENLEWMTGSENRQHAVDNGLTTVNKPIIVKNLETGFITEFPSLLSASKVLGLSDSKLSKILVNSKKPAKINGNEVSFKYEKHSIFANTNKREILVRDIRTGEVKEYESIVKCAEALGISKYIVQWRIDTPTTKLQPDFLQIKRKSDITPWYLPLDVERETLCCSWTKEILIRDTASGVITEFSTQREAAKYLGIAESTIYQRIAMNNQPIFKNENTGSLFQMKLKSDLRVWRISKDPFEEYKNSLQEKSVLVKNVITNEIKEYPSLKSCCDELGLLKSTLVWRLKTKGQKLYTDNKQYKYKNEILDFAKVDKTLISLISIAPINSNVN